MKFEGIYTPAITPLSADGSIDTQAFAEVLEFLVESKVHGIVIGGSTGEYYAHTAEERLALAAHASEVIAGRLPLVVGTGAIRTEDSLAYTGSLRHALRLSREIRAGIVTVNCFGEGDASTPFGGYKESGFGGRDKSVWAHDQYTELKTIWIDAS
ncbi:dihydrodipicolinate synthase family protein [Pseudomonas aeruginosa]|uniref:dihydrodipicolinate synthase family protein n=1 Tax=Pseudomonas aeruginosa TaxID=287 RepID=UPI001266A894|nr:dihydrodipicolinate synthase family protein [Pseudomonas aeruginosa]